MQVHCHAVSTPVNLARELLKGASSCVLFVLMPLSPFARNTCRFLPELAINLSGCDGRERPLKGCSSQGTLLQVEQNTTEQMLMQIIHSKEAVLHKAHESWKIHSSLGFYEAQNRVCYSYKEVTHIRTGNDNSENWPFLGKSRQLDERVDSCDTFQTRPVLVFSCNRFPITFRFYGDLSVVIVFF